MPETFRPGLTPPGYGLSQEGEMPETVIPAQFELAARGVATPLSQAREQIKAPPRARGYAVLALLGDLRVPTGLPHVDLTRLVVPVPASDADDGVWVRRVWEVAGAADLDILLVVVVHRPDADLQVQRRLTQLAAMLRRRGREVEASVEHGRTWVEVLRRKCRPGDVVAAPGAPGPQTLSPARQNPAEEILASLRLPLFRVDGLRVDMADRRPRLWLRVGLTWAAPLGVLALFAVVQAGIVTETHAWLQTLLLASSVAAELACLWVAESLVSLWK
jgi:hypothetical protein